MGKQKNNGTDKSDWLPTILLKYVYRLWLHFAWSECGAIAAVFGIYERIISFLAHITKNFKENVLFIFR